MGLDCSFDAWHGAYSAFNRFRCYVAECAGASFPPHSQAVCDKYPQIAESQRTNVWPAATGVWWILEDDGDFDEGIRILLSHSDCDGVIEWWDCKKVMRGLRKIRGRMRGVRDPHDKYRGGPKKWLENFIRGCRKAFRAKQPIWFG